MTLRTLRRLARSGALCMGLLASVSAGDARADLWPAERAVKVRAGGALALYVRKAGGSADRALVADGLPRGATLASVLVGDLDLDGYVGGGDLLALGFAFGAVAGSARYREAADLDADGGVGLADFVLFAGNWRRGLLDPGAARSGLLRWSPAADQRGPHEIVLRAQGEAAAARVAVEVLDAENEPPRADAWISVVRDGRLVRLDDDARRIFARDLVQLRVEADDDFALGWIVGPLEATYLWDFGDDAPTDPSSLSRNPTHRYERVGRFSASVMVWDNEGATTTVELPLDVVAKPAPPLGRPVDLVAGPVSGERIDLSWDPALDVDVLPRYELYRDGELVARLDGNHYRDEGLEPETAYRYHVLAVGEDGARSAPGDPVVQTTLAAGRFAPFTLAILPDTQFLTQTRSHIFEAQTDWIRDNKVAHNIAFVLHEGDVVQQPRHVAWANAVRAMDVLDGVVPSVIVPGNHDMGNSGFPKSRDTRLMNDAFPLAELVDDPTFLAAFEPDRIDNTARTFQAGGRDWLIVALEWGPRHAVLDWANTIVAAHPDHLVIYLTHDYLYHDGAWHGSADDHVSSADRGPLAKGPEGANSGFETWNAFVKRHANMRFTFSGHVLGDGTATTVVRGEQQNRVYQMLANYQHLPQGGGGFLRLVTLDPERGRVEVRTYSPFLDESKGDFENRFDLVGVEF